MNFNNFQVVKNYNELNLSNESLKIVTDNTNKVFRMNVETQNDFILSVFSDLKFEFMSIENYLLHNEKWKVEIFELQTQDILSNISNVICKIKIKNLF